MSTVEVTSPVKAKGYTLMIVLAGLALLAGSLQRSEAFWTQPIWQAMAALTVAAAVLGVRFSLPWRGVGGLAVTLGDCFVFSALLLFHPAAAVALSAIEALVANLRFRVKRVDRFFFNVGQMVMTTWVVGNFFGMIHFHADPSLLAPLDLDALPPLLACALLYFVLNSAFLATGMALTAGLSIWELWIKAFPFLSPVNLLNAAAALVASCSMETETGLSTGLAVLLGVTLLAVSQMRVRRFSP